MNRENRLLVTDEPVKFENYLVEVQDFTKKTTVLITSEESIDYALNEWREGKRNDQTGWMLWKH